MPMKLFTRRRSPPDSRAVPTVLGVTGHRDVREADVPLLRQALAEALRMQLYWVAAGIGETVTSSYPQQARSEMSWIRQAVQACSLGLHECGAAFTRLAAEHQMAWRRTISHYWLAGQQDYYHRRHAAYHRAYHRCHYGGLALAMLGWLLTLGLVAGDVLAAPDSRTRGSAPAPAGHTTPNEVW